MNIVKKTYYKFGAAIMTGLVVSVSENAFAQNNFSNISNNIGSSISGLPGMVSGISYLVGLLLGVLGVLKIKDHVENPTNAPLKDGAVRLAAGGALFAFPMVSEAMLNTVGEGEAISVQQLNAVDFSVK